MRAHLLTSLAALCAAIVLSPTASAQELELQARWQAAADASRLQLLAVPAPAGFALTRLTVSSPACGGHADAAVRAVFRRPDGGVVSVSQHDGFCGQLGDTYLGEVQVRGVRGALAALGTGPCITAPDAAPCRTNPYGGNRYVDGRTISFAIGGVEVVLSSNLADADHLLSMADAAAPIAPTPGLRPLVERFRARVVKVVRADLVRVRVAGRSRTLRLAGIRAPRARECWAPQARRLATRLMRGRLLWFEDDPRPGRRYWAFRGYRLVEGVPYRDPLNGRLVNAGAVKRAPGKWRYDWAVSQSAARSLKRGLWGSLCRGSFKRRPVAAPRPAAPAREPSRPSRPPRSDRYNCDDFPLADGTTAQDYLRLYPDDPSRLDGDNDGIACE